MTLWGPTLQRHLGDGSRSVRGNVEVLERRDESIVARFVGAGEVVGSSAVEIYQRFVSNAHHSKVCLRRSAALTLELQADRDQRHAIVLARTQLRGHKGWTGSLVGFSLEELAVLKEAGVWAGAVGFEAWQVAVFDARDVEVVVPAAAGAAGVPVLHGPGVSIWDAVLTGDKFAGWCGGGH